MNSPRDQEIKELKSFTVLQLRDFLRMRGKSVVGRKQDLLSRAELFFNEPVRGPDSNNNDPNSLSPSSEWISLDGLNLEWKPLSELESSTVPKDFDISVITKYLCEDVVSFQGTDKFEVDVGTKKPAVKGRQMYLSEKLFYVDFAKKDAQLYFRGKCEASLKKSEIRRPVVSVNEDGKITNAGCNCVAQADCRCCHVAVLLYMLEDLTLNISPKIRKACTSTQQKWGQGSSRKSNPQPVFCAQYGKKFKTDRYIKFDPRPPALAGTSEKEKDEFLHNLQGMEVSSMWEKLLKFKFSDEEPDSERKEVLKILSNKFVQNLKSSLEIYEYDKLTSSTCYHVTGTEKQSNSPKWVQERKYRVTASSIKSFLSNPITKCNELWTPKHDLSGVKSIAWGQEHENEAKLCFEDLFGVSVSTCGLFVSKEMPFLGASPDGLVSNALVEIKCPWILRDLKTTDLDKLTQQQRSSFCCTLDVQKNLWLKKSHAYYYQVQTQMFVTGIKQTFFVI